MLTLTQEEWCCTVIIDAVNVKETMCMLPYESMKSWKERMQIWDSEGIVKPTLPHW
jgi:hypothetical protein